jgi:glc operon protein GlcG
MIDLTLDMAERAAKAALAKAKSLGTVMTASVVDEAGRTVVIMRGDGAGFFSPDTSRKKAVAAANFRKATKELGEQAAKGSPFWSAVPAALAGEILPSIGAVPIVTGGRVIGAIGCGGGTGEQDHECAMAGAEAVAKG